MSGTLRLEAPRLRRTLREHQQHAMELLRKSLSTGHRRPMLQLPTGAGKTVIAGAIIAGALAKGKKVIMTVPAVSLIDQTVSSLWAEGIYDVGVIQAKHELTDWDMPVQVASIQTLMKYQIAQTQSPYRRRIIPEAHIVLIDEAHKQFAYYGNWMRHPDWEKVPFIGLSATPWTKGLGKIYDDLIIAATTAELIEKGFLSPFRAFGPPSGLKPELAGISTVAGDYHEGELSAEMRKPKLVADAVTTWLSHGEDRPTLCFAVDCAHARALHKQFLQGGVPAEYIDAHTTLDERAAIGAKFHSGEIKVVCNVGTLTTGIDWDVRCISLCRPTKSESLYVQIIGRGLRIAHGKSNMILLDHTDTTENLGYVTDIHHDTLCDGNPQKSKGGKDEKKEKALPKKCPGCHLLKPAGIHKCPDCGFEPQRQSKLVHEQGELHEITGGKSKAEKADKPTKQRWFSMLLHYEIERSYKHGWAANQYRKKFGVWPKGLDDVSLRPDGEVANYIKSRQIAYANSRDRGSYAERTAA